MSFNRLLLILIGLLTISSLIFNFLILEHVKNLSATNLELKSNIAAQTNNDRLNLEELAKKSRQSTSSSVLGTDDQISNKYITINDEKWEPVSVYKEKSYSSQVVTKVEFGQIYPYSQRKMVGI